MLNPPYEHSATAVIMAILTPIITAPRGITTAASPSPSRLTASAGRCTGGWHVMQRQPFGSCRSVHHRAPWHARHDAPGGGLLPVGPGRRMRQGCWTVAHLSHHPARSLDQRDVISASMIDMAKR
jgi:hypothetical protein